MSEEKRSSPLLATFVALIVIAGLAALLWPITQPGSRHRRQRRSDHAASHSTVPEETGSIRPTNFQNPATSPQPRPTAVASHNALVDERLRKRQQDMARIQKDADVFEVLNAGLSNLARVKALPPWVPERINPADVKNAAYSDHPPLGGNIRVATDYIPNMRFDRILGVTSLKVLEIRYDANGQPINVASVSNGPSRGALLPPVAGAADAFGDRATQIFQSMGYDMSQFIPCVKAGWNYDARTGGNFIAIRSFQKKDAPAASYPDLSLNLCCPNNNAKTAFVTGYFIFSSPAPRH